MDGTARPVRKRRIQELRTAVGLGPESRSAFRPYLYNKQPTEDQAKRLAAIIGWPPEVDEPEAEPPEIAPDVATSLAALVQELRTWREQDRDRIAGLENLVGSQAARLQLVEAQLERQGRPVPQVTAG